MRASWARRRRRLGLPCDRRYLASTQPSSECDRVCRKRSGVRASRDRGEVGCACERQGRLLRRDGGVPRVGLRGDGARRHRLVPRVWRGVWRSPLVACWECRRRRPRRSRVSSRGVRTCAERDSAAPAGRRLPPQPCSTMQLSEPRANAHGITRSGGTCTIMRQLTSLKRERGVPTAVAQSRAPCDSARRVSSTPCTAPASLGLPMHATDSESSCSERRCLTPSRKSTR